MDQSPRFAGSQNLQTLIAVISVALAICVEAFLVLFALLWAGGAFWAGFGEEMVVWEASLAAVLAVVLGIVAGRWFHRNLGAPEAGETLGS